MTKKQHWKKFRKNWNRGQRMANRELIRTGQRARWVSYPGGVIAMYGYIRWRRCGRLRAMEDKA